MSLPAQLAYGGRAQPDPARVALCRHCDVNPWHDPRLSGEWTACSAHIGALDDETNPAKQAVLSGRTGK